HVVANRGEFLPGQPEASLEDGPTVTLLPRMLGAAFFWVEEDRTLGGGDAGTLADSEDELFTQVVLAPLFGVGALVAVGKERVRVRQITEPFGAIVLDRQLRQRPARHRLQSHDNLRDAGLVEGVLDQLAD